MERFQTSLESYPDTASGEIQLTRFENERSQQTLLPMPCLSPLGTPVTIIRRATLNDICPIHELYKIVGRIHRGNLTQEDDEITLKYVSDVLQKGIERGLVLVIDQENRIIGYLKAFTSPFRCMAHVLTNTTMMVHPEWQGHG